MTLNPTLEVLGAPGSPYTRKLIAALRYRRIRHVVFWGRNALPDTYPDPKVRLLPTVYFPEGEGGQRIPVTDTTPILMRLEAEHEERSLIPKDPALAFINALIEDYADEWLTKAMFHYRWAFEADWKNAAPLLVYWNTHTIDADAAAQMSAQFAERQIERLPVVGSNPVTAETIERSYSRFVSCLDALIARRGFILGARPSTADFAIFGQMTQLAIVEPTAAAITQSISQRVRAWVDIIEDLSGLNPSEADWLAVEDAHHLKPLLVEIGRTYAPAMAANAKAILAGKETFKAQIDDRAWTQPVFKYQAKCLGWLRDAYGALPTASRQAVDDLLEGTGCEMLFG
ncbi:MAG: glutathione S-transferase [Pseudomonadota bacterium]